MPWPARMLRIGRPLGLAALLFAAAPSVRAQGERLDVGSFTILREGARVGREQFSLWRVTDGSGTAFELRAESAIAERRIATRLETDSAGTPLRYVVEVREGTTPILRLAGQRVRDRFSTIARTDRGEAAREYRLPDGTVVLETEVFHQAALLLRGRRGRTDFRVQAIAPMEQRQRAVRVTLDAAADTVAVGAARLPAARWVLDDGSSDRRVLWIDAEGRVLRVTVPARGLDAVRDDPPR